MNSLQKNLHPTHIGDCTAAPGPFAGTYIVRMDNYVRYITSVSSLRFVAISTTLVPGSRVPVVHFWFGGPTLETIRPQDGWTDFWS